MTGLRLSNAQTAFQELDVVPPQPEQFAASEARGERHDGHPARRCEPRRFGVLGRVGLQFAVGDDQVGDHSGVDVPGSVPIPDRLVLELARLIDDEELDMKLRSALGRDIKVLALETEERETILVALEDPPAGLEELRAVLTFARSPLSRWLSS